MSSHIANTILNYKKSYRSCFSPKNNNHLREWHSVQHFAVHQLQFSRHFEELILECSCLWPPAIDFYRLLKIDWFITDVLACNNVYYIIWWMGHIQWINTKFELILQHLSVISIRCNPSIYFFLLSILHFDSSIISSK